MFVFIASAYVFTKLDVFLPQKPFTAPQKTEIVKNKYPILLPHKFLNKFYYKTFALSSKSKFVRKRAEKHGYEKF